MFAICIDENMAVMLDKGCWYLLEKYTSSGERYCADTLIEQSEVDVLLAPYGGLAALRFLHIHSKEVS